jgi:hypothetical protein
MIDARKNEYPEPWSFVQEFLVPKQLLPHKMTKPLLGAHKILMAKRESKSSVRQWLNATTLFSV